MSVILTVSQINRYIASRFREDTKLHGKLICGEISNFSCYAGSGHMYFSLKDSESVIKAVMFKNSASRLQFMPKNGMKVIVSADVGVYEQNGVYQLYVTDMQPDGVGTLYLAREQLEKKLSEEGVFDEKNKKPLPELPKKIGIVTSTEAAALQDMLNILSRRYPLAEVTVFPALVQGQSAPDSICKALKLADSRGMDLLICGRGGGSLEDLSAFNSEKVARCVHECKTPIISAVGHETDFSVSDMAADMRAPTPSAAAELAVPDIKTVYGSLDVLEKRLNDCFANRIDEYRNNLEILSKRLESLNPKRQSVQLRDKLLSLEKRLTAAYKLGMQRRGGIVAEKAAAVENLSPLKTLSRGYSLVYRDGILINSAEKLSAGDTVKIQLSDGTVSAEIK